RVVGRHDLDAFLEAQRGEEDGPVGRPGERARDLVAEPLAATGHAAADHDDLGIPGERQGAYARRRPAREIREDRARGLVARVGALRDLLDRLPGAAGNGSAAREDLDAAELPARAPRP